MRSSLLLLLAACGASTPSSPLRTAAGAEAGVQPSSFAPALAAPQPAATAGPPRPAAAAEPPAADPSSAAAAAPSVPALLAQPGELFMLVVQRGKPMCERWTVEPAARRLRTTTRVGGRTVARDIGYAVRGDQLELADFVRHEDVADPALRHASSTCTQTDPMREVDGALAVGDARWYRSAAACAGAIRQHARTATELVCALPAPVPRAAQAATRTRFEAVLRRGGAMFSIVDGPRGPWCQTLTFTPRRDVPGMALNGLVSYPITDGTERGTMSYNYSLAAGSDELTLAAPHFALAGSNAVEGCYHTTLIKLLADHVRLDDALYFTRARCRRALAEQVEHDRWFPQPSLEPEDPVEAEAEAGGAVTVIGVPGLGSC